MWSRISSVTAAVSAVVFALSSVALESFWVMAYCFSSREIWTSRKPVIFLMSPTRAFR